MSFFIMSTFLEPVHIANIIKSIFVKDAIELLALVMDVTTLNLAALQNINITLLMLKWNIP